MLSCLQGGFNMNNNESENRIITFRQTKFQKLLSELEHSVSGLALPILPYIRTQQGKYSQRKTVALINCILDGLDVNDQKLLDFYHSLLYCSIRVLSIAYILYDERGNSFALAEDQTNIDPTFSDLVELLHCDDRYLFEGVRKQPLNELLAETMIAVYEVLSEKKCDKSFILFGRIDYDPDYFLEPSWADYPDDVDAFQNQEESFDPILEEQKLQKDQQNSRLKREFSYPDEYCQHFETILNQFEDYFDFKFFNTHIQNMINNFLASQGLSIFNDENSYITICTYIKKTIKKSNQIQGERLNGNR